MSYCREEGKDRIIFVTEEDHKGPDLPIEEDYGDEQEGLIREDGTINWECPCLGGMASGPCGVEFRESFTCFHYSTEEMKGSDCLEEFRTLQNCMTKYPEYYTRSNKGLDEEQDAGGSGGTGENDDDGGSGGVTELNVENTLKESTEHNVENSVRTENTTSAEDGKAL